MSAITIQPVEQLVAEQRRGTPDRAASHTLHVEPDGSFSITAEIAITLHIYGTAVTRVRRYYDLSATR